MAAYCFKKGPVIYVGRIYFKKAKYGFISVAKISGIFPADSSSGDSFCSGV